MEFVILAMIGLAAGVIGALVGLGGGIILVPATLFIGINLGWIDGITPQSVVGLISNNDDFYRTWFNIFLYENENS